MSYFSKMLDVQLILFVYLVIGSICRRLNIITSKNQGQFINFVLNIIMPCMVFNSFKNITFSILQQAIVALLTSFGVCLLAMFLGKNLYRNFSEDKQKVLRYATLINNAGFAGLPLAQALYGEQGLVYASIFLIPIRIFMWSAGITILSKKKSNIKQLLIRLLKNINIIAVFLGIFRGLFQIQLPDFLDNAILNLSSCVSPLSMIVIGAIISDIDVRGILEKGVLGFTFIRLLLLPLLTLIITSLFQIDVIIAGVSVVLTAMPAATSTSLLAFQNDLDETFASKLIFITTVGSLLTTPVIVLLTQYVLANH
ncbi:AEC family transporter [Streptococcus merionis]|uniref:AEC family transporter n=1 Tax=Streptococcus merionis TaxID=400065 RepID=UPI0035111C8C